MSDPICDRMKISRRQFNATIPLVAIMPTILKVNEQPKIKKVISLYDIVQYHLRMGTIDCGHAATSSVILIFTIKKSPDITTTKKFRDFCEKYHEYILSVSGRADQVFNVCRADAIKFVKNNQEKFQYVTEQRSSIF